MNLYVLAAAATMMLAASVADTVREMYNGALSLDAAVETFRNIDQLFPTRRIARGAEVHPLDRAPAPLTNVKFLSGGARRDLSDYLKLNRVAALLVLKNGRVALEVYQYGNTDQTRWMSMSIAKSITSTLIGSALKEGYIKSLDDPVTKYVPRLERSAYDGVSIRDVLMMASGVKWNEAYTDPNSDRRRLLEAQIAQKPGALMDLMAKLPRAARPGTAFTYSTGETQVAAEIVRGAVGKSLSQYLSERIWSKFGMQSDASWWLDSPDGVEIGGSGISATLRDYGRFGLFILGGGVASGEQILPSDWTVEAGKPHRLRDGTVVPYGYMWWPAVSAQSLRDGAFQAIGIFGQHLYINPANEIVIVVLSAQTKPVGGAALDDIAFFDAVVAALKGGEA